MQAGLESLGAVELRNAVTIKFAIDLPITVVFDYPTIASLAGFVSERLQPLPSVLLQGSQVRFVNVII